MKTWIKALGIAGLLTSAVAFADAVIFSGNDVKTLKPNIDLFGQSKILSGTVDPTSVATSAPVGSIYLNTSNGNLYRKVDAGSSTNWQRVGSAAVAGNLLPNPDWETGSTQWTASAGTYTRTTTAANVGFGAGSGSWDASATSQTLTSTATAIPTGLYGANGLARCYFKTAATDYVLQAYDGTNILASAAIPASTQYQQYGVNFPFPSSGSVSLRVVSASDAAVIYMDDCYVGPAANLQSVNQANMYGSLNFTPTAGCFWSGSSTSFADLSANATCPTATVTGQATSSGKTPSITFSSLPPGDYVVMAVGTYGCNASTVPAGILFTMSDGTTTNGVAPVQCAAGGTNNVTADGALVSRFSYSVAQSNVTFKVQARTTAGASNSAFLGAGNASNEHGYTMTVIRMPSTSELAYRPDQVAWRVDANISGGLISMGTSTYSTYQGVQNSSLALTQNAGSIAVQIGCDSTNPPTGATCTAGPEQPDISFTVPTAGSVLACASFTWEGVSGAAGAVLPAFQLVETATNSQTILQEGKSRIYGRTTNIGPDSNTVSTPFRVCGNFEFASSGQKMLRLFSEQLVSGTITSSYIAADASTSIGQRDIHWEVYPITQAIPAPLLVGSVTSNSSGLERVERLSVGTTCSASPCTITSQSGSWVSSVTRNSAGDYTINIPSGIFSIKPTCTITPGGAFAAPNVIYQSSSTATAYTFYTRNSSNVGTDNNFEVICMGPR